MDPFTQGLLDRASQRSRALGVTSPSKTPMSKCLRDVNTGDAIAAMASQPKPQQQQLQKKLTSQASSSTTTNASTNTAGSSRLQVVETTAVVDACDGATPQKVLRQFSAVNKENMDLGIEINIVTNDDVDVQVQVETQDVTDDEGEVNHDNLAGSSNEPVAKLRDTSRNRLQRLGALYSNTVDLSSPIHRTEGHFHADSNEEVGGSKKPKQRYGKLAALANTINQWEDDTSHHSLHAHPPQPQPRHLQQEEHAQGVAPKGSVVPPPKPALPSRNVVQPTKKAQAPAPPTSAKGSKQGDASVTNAGKTKQLNWDPKVMHSLEAQGFQRRDSSTVKLAYDYGKENRAAEKAERATAEIQSEQQPPEIQSESSNVRPNVAKLASAFGCPATASDDKKSAVDVKRGLVSGRAAAFEHIAVVNQAQQQQRPQKDPTELSLKERMQLFEKNKGEALIPKAAFGMAPSMHQIRQEGKITRSKEDLKATQTSSSTSAALAPATSDGKLRDKVAALVANSGATISENKIKADIMRQRQEDMQVLANRFQRQKELAAMPAPPPPPVVAPLPAPPPHKVKNMDGSQVMRPPPPPPPMPNTSLASSSKRRSPGGTLDEESKRARKSAVSTERARLYPALSDLESTETCSDDDEHCATTATASGVDEELLAASRRRQSRAAIGARHEEHKEEDEDNDSYMESEADDSSADICNGSLGREIMQVVCSKDQQQSQRHAQQAKRVKGVHYADKDSYYSADEDGGGDSSMNSSEESIGMDEYLDEALDDEDGDDDITQGSGDEHDVDIAGARNESGSGKGTTSSNSFTYRKTPRKHTPYQTIPEDGQAQATTSAGPPPVRSQLVVNREDENMVTLVHTVSFYRRQQNENSANSTPVRKICREQLVPRGGGASAQLVFESPAPSQRSGRDNIDASYSDTEDSQSDSECGNELVLVEDKVKRLLDEVCTQQQVIAQTSQLLNLCAATVEFSGSTESVEGERHLLVATHRRQACLDEVQRLRIEKSLRPLGAPSEKGCLTVKEITVPLRQDYIRKLATDTIAGHNLVCLLKYNEHVLATKTVPTLPGLLAVKFPDVLQIKNVYADFKITLEIYGMTAQREVLPHEVKYHINVNKKSGIKTPKRKGGENRLVMPPVQSPAGPHVVRTPALVQYGFAIFSLREIQRTTWSLTQVLGVCPLDGSVHMKVNCELSVSVEYRGFLNMFEDVSGCGAWHRRWCYLNGAMLNYWKYPDDERKKTPIGSIDLYTCSSQKVGLAPREICARLHTMLLECQRPAKDTDRESLIIVPNGRTTIVRHLLSADTKEEREEWCAYFNKALTLLRAWGPPQ